jgi:hypothetical protein
MSGVIEVRRRPIRAIQYDGLNANEVVEFAHGAVEWRGRAGVQLRGGPQIITGEWIVWEPRDGFGLYTDEAFRRIYDLAAALPAPGEET